MVSQNPSINKKYIQVTNHEIRHLFCENSIMSSLIATKAKRSGKMTESEKIQREKERCKVHSEMLIAWGCFDEIIPGDAFLKYLCRSYESWAYKKYTECKKKIYPAPKEWIADNEAMQTVNKEEQFHHSHNLNDASMPLTNIEIGFVGYIRSLDDKDIIQKAKTAIFELWTKEKYANDLEKAQKEANKHWKILLCGHSLGAQIVRELRTNKERLIQLLEKA
jgi:hypothetical protein